MDKYSYDELLHEESFTKEDILDAALVTHPKAKACNLTEEDLKRTLIYERMFSFTK